MTGYKLGRDFAALLIEAQITALREQLLAQELLLKVLLTAVERLGVNFVWPGDDEPEVSDQGIPNPVAPGNS